MIAGDDLGEPEARQPHEAGGAAPTREEVDELHRRPVAPVQIFRDQQQRPILGVAIEEFTHLPEHALRGCSHELLRSASRSSAVLTQGNCNNQVGATARSRGGTSAFRRQSSASASSTGWYGSPAPYCCTHWPRAHATSPSPEAKCSISVVLPIPGSPAIQTIAASPGCGAFPSAAKTRKHRRAADEGRRSSRASAPCERVVLRVWRTTRRCADRRSCSAYRDGNEPITASRHRFDEAWAPRIVAEHRTDVADRALQYRVADEPVAPDLVEQGVLRQQGAGMPDESAQQAERRRRERDRASTAKQQRIRLVELELAEAYA